MLNRISDRRHDVQSARTMIVSTSTTAIEADLTGSPPAIEYPWDVASACRPRPGDVVVPLTPVGPTVTPNQAPAPWSHRRPTRRITRRGRFPTFQRHGSRLAARRRHLLGHRPGRPAGLPGRRRRLFQRPQGGGPARPPQHPYHRLGRAQPHPAGPAGTRRPLAAQRTGALPGSPGAPPARPARARARLGLAAGLRPGARMAAAGALRLVHPPAPVLRAGRLPPAGGRPPPETGGHRRRAGVHRRSRPGAQPSGYP